MNPNHVTSLELSKKLKESGYKQEGEFWWKENMGIVTLCRRSNFAKNFDVKEYDSSLGHNISVSPLANELMEKMPDWWQGEDSFGIVTFKDCGTWFVQARRNLGFGEPPIADFNDENLCNALAKMYIYLAENKLLEGK